MNEPGEFSWFPRAAGILPVFGGKPGSHEMTKECCIYLCRDNGNKFLFRRNFFMAGGSGADGWVPLWGCYQMSDEGAHSMVPFTVPLIR
jgi:hypothetical protein